MSVDAGIDYPATADDIDTTFPEEREPGANLLQDCSIALTELRGILYWDPTATDDLSQYRNSAMDPARLAEVKARVTAALGGHPLLSGLQVDAQFDVPTLTLIVRIDITAIDGTKLTLQLTLNEQGFEVKEDDS